MASILGIDYGGKRVGLAIADRMDRLAVQHGVLENSDDLLNELRRIVNVKDIEKIVVGLPLGLSGKETEQTHATRNFVATLSGLGIPVDTMDERMTSVQGGSDSGAAVLILQSYLDKEENAV